MVNLVAFYLGKILEAPPGKVLVYLYAAQHEHSPVAILEMAKYVLPMSVHVLGVKTRGLPFCLDNATSRYEVRMHAVSLSKVSTRSFVSRVSTPMFGLFVRLEDIDTHTSIPS